MEIMGRYIYCIIIYIFMHTYIYIYDIIYVHIIVYCIDIYVMYVYIYIYMYIYIHMYIYICNHTHQFLRIPKYGMDDNITCNLTMACNRGSSMACPAAAFRSLQTWWWWRFVKAAQRRSDLLLKWYLYNRIVQLIGVTTFK